MSALRVDNFHLLYRLVADVTFVTELATAGCITWSQRDHVLSIARPLDRNDKLLQFLSRRSVTAFNRFINVLAKRQANLVPLLLTDAGET